MRTTARLLCTAALMCVVGELAKAEEQDPRPAAGIQDNSFIIEEAYNQEPGVIQHINAWRWLDNEWFYTLTDEWPVVTQLHQLSLTVPYSWIDNDGENERGFGDLQVNYRYQLSFESARRPAIAPRATLILPTGDEKKGLGAGSSGFQTNLPVSKIVSDRVTLNGNAGLTTYFDIDGQSPTSYNLGGSAIYAVTRDFNFMLEALQEWTETVNETGQIDHDDSFTLSPGARFALNLQGGTQVVFGAAAPIRFEESRTDYGAFLYLSVEHGVSWLPH